ncbi:MAG: hypothetical protein WC998_03470 [Candidatus Paceibacterota bacterium]|jgi:hypothetical protein
MATLTERLLVEFDENTIKNHIIPVIEEWLLSNRMRKQNQDYGRRTSHDTTIDLLIARAKRVKDLSVVPKTTTEAKP